MTALNGRQQDIEPRISRTVFTHRLQEVRPFSITGGRRDVRTLEKFNFESIPGTLYWKIPAGAFSDLLVEIEENLAFLVLLRICSEALNVGELLIFWSRCARFYCRAAKWNERLQEIALKEVQRGLLWVFGVPSTYSGKFLVCDIGKQIKRK